MCRGHGEHKRAHVLAPGRVGETSWHMLVTWPEEEVRGLPSHQGAESMWQLPPDQLCRNSLQAKGHWRREPSSTCSPPPTQGRGTWVVWAPPRAPGCPSCCVGLRGSPHSLVITRSLWDCRAAAGRSRSSRCGASGPAHSERRSGVPITSVPGSVHLPGGALGWHRMATRGLPAPLCGHWAWGGRGRTGAPASVTWPAQGRLAPASVPHHRPCSLDASKTSVPGVWQAQLKISQCAFYF